MGLKSAESACLGEEGIAHGWVDLTEVNEPKDREGRERERGAERNRWEHVIGSMATTTTTAASAGLSEHSPAGGKCQLLPFSSPVLRPQWRYSEKAVFVEIRSTLIRKSRCCVEMTWSFILILLI